jgi:hypothetical protein
MQKTMTHSAKSVLVFGVYLNLVGATLLFIPNDFLTIIGVENTSEVWIRLSGILLMALSAYYIVAARHNLSIIFKVTAWIRCSIIFFFSAFVYLQMMEPIMLLFAFVDFAGGLWTYYAMMKEGSW